MYNRCTLVAVQGLENRNRHCSTNADVLREKSNTQLVKRNGFMHSVVQISKMYRVCVYVYVLRVVG